MKQEIEVAMKLLEKDTHEKQDTLAALRLQLDQVKTLNVQMFHKAQVQIDEHDYNFVFRTYTHTYTQIAHLSNSCGFSGLGPPSRKKAGRGRAA